MSTHTRWTCGLAVKVRRCCAAFAFALAACISASVGQAQEQQPQYVTSSTDQGLEPQPQPPRRRRVMRPICSVRAAGQATAFGFALGIPVFAGGAEVGVNCPRLDFNTVHFAPGLAFSYMNGSTEHGLDYEVFAFGPEAEVAPASFDRLKFALGFGLEIPTFQRITNGDTLTFVSLQTNGRVSIDLLREGRFALWFGIGVRAATYAFSDISLTPSAQLGLRI